MVNSSNLGASDVKLMLTENEGMEFQTAYVLNRKRAISGLSGASGLRARLWIPNNGLATINLSAVPACLRLYPDLSTKYWGCFSNHWLFRISALVQ